MGLKFVVSIFILILLIANIIIFFFVRGVNVIDKFKAVVLGLVSRYLPLGDPLLVLLLASFVGLIAVAFIMLKVMSGGKAA